MTDRANDAVAVGGDLDVSTLLAAYRQGLFPMHIDDVLVWWSPQARGILLPGKFHASRSLQRSARRYTTTIDRAFAAVIAGCAEPNRAGGWINEEITAAYIDLHQAGVAHSIEVWDGRGELVGGLYGVALGGLFAAESKFSRQRDASKVALAHLVRVVGAGRESLIDVQWLTPHLQSLGCCEVSAAEYQKLLGQALRMPSLDWESICRTTPEPAD